MTAKMSIRDLTRSGSSLLEYDYIDIEDKKAHEYKGVFVSNKYADEVKEFLDEKIEREQKKVLQELMQFAGSNTLREECKDMTSNELRSARHKKYDDA